MTRAGWKTVVLCLAVTGFSGVSVAAPRAVGQFKDWKVFVQSHQGETLCFAATEAKDKAPQSAEHGDVWFYVTQSRSGRARNQPSLRVGYELREDLPSTARIGRAAWTLYNVGNEAFADDEDDSRLVRAIERGTELRVEGVSSRDTSVAYHFSLSGSANAIKSARDACRSSR
ncbi:MAG: invasion associated locus B family protein [Pseudomonadota bacterium]